MFIAQFLFTGDVLDFHIDRDPIARLGTAYSKNPIGFKNAVDEHMDRSFDPGQRHLLLQLLPYVAGNAANAGLDVVQQIRQETAPKRNYLHLGESTCGLVKSWWKNVSSGDIRV